MPLELSTLEEWDALIKQHSLYLKHDSQLFYLEESIDNKIPRVNRDLTMILLFPDAKKAEICWNYIDSGEMPDYLSMEYPVAINASDQEKIDAEYQHEVAFYTTKLSWLEEKLACCKKEMELRADRLVARTPKGTPYFIDFDNGHDVNNDGTTAIKTNGDGPWATLDKATATLVAGDVVTVRRGMVQAVSQDLAFANDGTILLPITMEADFDNTDWGAGGDETTASETATLTFGSKTVTFAGDISGDIAANDWIYETTEDNRLFAYEVASVAGGSNEIVTLYLPYKGNISGAGKTIEIIPANPIWNIAAGNFEANLDGDHFWKFQGLWFRGTDGNGTFEVDSVNYVEFRDSIFEGNGGGDPGLRSPSDSILGLISKCRTYNCDGGIFVADFREQTVVRDCYIDANNAGYGVKFASGGTLNAIDVEIENCGAQGDISVATSPGRGGGYVRMRNSIMASNPEIDLLSDSDNFNFRFYSEDYDQTVSSNQQRLNLSTTDDGDLVIERETTEVRPGGGATSIKVTPVTELGPQFELTRIKLFDWAIDDVTKDVEVTYTVYLRSDDDTDWDADPANTELWIEAEYWGHATNAQRRLLKSTEVCNNFDADDTVWDTLTVTFTPLITGNVYLRGYYCKAKEAGNSNIFYCDNYYGIS